MNISEELYALFRENFPFAVREEATARQILADAANRVLVRRSESGRLIGAAVIRGAAILMLCVSEPYRGRGIGSALLAEAEKVIQNAGFGSVAVGVGDDYLTPGVPTSKRYYLAENEALYPGLDDAASRFFEKRGYRHSWDCNCFDMRFLLDERVSTVWRSGDTVDGIVYRWAANSDCAAICACVDDAWPDFTQYYRNAALYGTDPARRVMVAEGDGLIVGALMVLKETEGPGLGSIGCTAVRQTYQGRHIAVNLTCLAVRYLKDAGMREAFLGYTYSGLDHMYGYAGFRICAYYMMAVKNL